MLIRTYVWYNKYINQINYLNLKGGDYSGSLHYINKQNVLF